MTTAAAATTEFSVDELTTLALQSIGFLNPGHPAKEGDLALGRRLLALGTQALANDGIVVRARERVTLTLTAGTNYVDAAADTVSIEKGGVMRGTSNNDIEITMVGHRQYQTLSNKTIEGMPTYYFPEQQSTGAWRIYFWPVPSVDWTTFIVPRVRRSRDVSTGNVTVDFDPKWQLCLVKFLSAELARSKGRRDLATEIMGEYQWERERAMNNETDRGDAMFVACGTPWD
jgi:hypothetical protein